MLYNSRVLAFLIALCVSLITTVSIAFFDSVSIYALIATSVVSFLVSGALLYGFLEYLIFREIDRIYKLIEKLKKRKQPISPSKRKPGKLSPAEKINEEILQLNQLKQKEIDELKKLEAFRKEFIADISHELKTPIFAAQGFVHTLLDGAVNDKAVRGKFLKKAAKSLDGLDALVQDLLTLSHIETGQIKMHFERFDMYELTEEVIDQLEDKAEKRNIRLKIEGHAQKVIVYADWQRITQVMTNLISNAIKHSNEGGEVLVRFEEAKKQVHVTVTDFGEGIPSEHVERIFERFYRVDKSRSREKGGTGLGLAIVKHILENHGTKAEVESAPGKGSSFSFKLPHSKPESHPEGAEL
jgi:two-component system phosphate regulon sensor histidine kinase PhoR